MRFVDRLRAARVQRKNVLVCVAGSRQEWEAFTPWWKNLGFGADCTITAIAHAWGEVPAAVDRELFAEITVDQPRDTLAMVERLIAPKCVNWEKPDEPICDREGADFAYGLLKVGHRKRIIEMQADKPFDIVVFGTPAMSPDARFVIPALRTVYSKVTPWPGAWTNAMNERFFYCGSSEFNSTSLFFRHLPIIKPAMFRLKVRGINDPPPEKIPLGMAFYYHHMMIRTNVKDPG